MPELRGALADAGFEDVRTYVQSGNIVLSSKHGPDEVSAEVARLIEARFGLEINVVARSRAQLAKVVERNPLGDVADNPKRYQVSFLSDRLPAGVLDKLKDAKAEHEAVVAIGREVYAWHPDGVGRSKLWTALAGRGLGVIATSRNWTTVTTLLEMAG